MTDHELSELMRKSSHKAQRAFFDEYFNYVYTIVYSRLHTCGSREDIDECVADVFSEFFMQFAKGSKFSGELHAVIGTLAKSRSIDAFRRLSRNSERSISIDEADELRDDADIAANAENRDTSRRLLDVIGSLGEPDSTIIIQRYYFDRTAKDIGRKLSLSPAAVQMRCQRAIKKLRGMLDKEGITL